MKKITLFTLLLVFVNFGFSQKIKIHVQNCKDTTVNLLRYFGKNMYYADTAVIKGGIVEFNGKKQTPGMLALYLPDKKWVEFIYNNEEIEFSTDAKDPQATRKFMKSEENKMFFDYLDYLGKQREKMTKLQDEKTAIKDEKNPTSIELTEKIKALSAEVEKYQLDLIAKNPTKLASKILKMTMEVKIPDAPKDADGKITDSLFQYKYYKSHFWDNIDLRDDRLVGTAIFQNKLEEFFSDKMLIQYCDTIVNNAFQLCDRLDPKSKMFEFCVTWIITTYQKSKIMGMDKVFYMMSQKYYCSKNAEGKSPAFWMPAEKLPDLCKTSDEMKNTVLGIKPPNVILPDTSGVWRDFYSLKNEYVVLFFWDPDCGHCKLSTPKLEKLYSQKLKARGIEVFAIAKAVDKNFEMWKKFIKDNHLTFTNVGLTEPVFKVAIKDASPFVPKYTNIESLNFKTTFNIYSTPTIFVLDKNRKIIAKQLSISQLEDFFDHTQGINNPVKIIPPDKEEDEHMSH